MRYKIDTIPLTTSVIHATCNQLYTTGLTKKQLLDILTTSKTAEDRSPLLCIKFSNSMTEEVICRLILLPIHSATYKSIKSGDINKRELFQNIKNNESIPQILPREVKESCNSYIALAVGAVDGKVAAKCIRCLVYTTQPIIPIHNSGVFKVFEPATYLPRMDSTSPDEDLSDTDTNTTNPVKHTFIEQSVRDNLAYLVGLPYLFMFLCLTLALMNLVYQTIRCTLTYLLHFPNKLSVIISVSAIVFIIYLIVKSIKDEIEQGDE